MIKAIAIDDEKNALGIIKEFCYRIPDMELAEVFTDPLKALPYISKHPDIELLFLDIQMTKLNGMVLAQNLPDEKPRIILTTAYPDYALKGYEMDVIDYLLKPFSFERFDRSVQKVRSVLNKPTSVFEKNMVRLTPGIDDFVFVKTDYKTLKVRLSEILYIEGSGNYVTLHTSKSKIMALQNLKLFEEQLQPYKFIRIHKSYIISVNFIDAIDKSSVWIGNKELPIGDSYKGIFKEFMNFNYKQI